MTALLGCFLGVGFVWVINAGIDSEITKYGTYGITALTTLLASSFAWAGVMMNIENQNSIENSKRSAELIVARASLNPTLSQISKICRRGVEISMQHDLGDLSKEEMLGQLTISSEALDRIAATIRYAELSDAKRMANIIRHYQVIFARTERVAVPNNNHFAEQVESAVDWAVLYTLVSDCFEYAREESEAIPTEISLDLDSFFFGTMHHVRKTDLLKKTIGTRKLRTNPELF